jgi:flavin-binding protein dodecin
MPYEGEDLEEGGRERDERTFEGVSRASLDDAMKKAVHAANQPHGTWLKVHNIQVLSVDDPNIGAYKVDVTPGG